MRAKKRKGGERENERMRKTETETGRQTEKKQTTRDVDRQTDGDKQTGRNRFTEIERRQQQAPTQGRQPQTSKRRARWHSATIKVALPASQNDILI